ncbi:hypothetical protein HKD37_18G051089 [Glycine soja]
MCSPPVSTTPPPPPPPPSPPSLPPTSDASASTSAVKRTRKASRLRSLSTRPPGVKRPVVHVDPATGKADGPHRKKLRTYLGILARDKVDITYENWKEDVRMKAQAIQKQNTAPHVLSRGGYDYLEQKLLAEKTKKKMQEAAQSGSIDGVIDRPSPVRRHLKWKMARTKKTREMTTEAAKEIAEKINVLAAAIGRPEHPGRVRGTGAGVTIKKYFGSAPRTSRSASSLPPDELHQLTQQIRD